MPSALVSLSGGSSAAFRSSTILTATASTFGKVTFYANGKKIPGCNNISTTGASPFTATCNWQPVIHNSVALKAKFKPYKGLTSSSSVLTPIVEKRVTNR